MNIDTRAIINISKNLNSIALSLISISNLYEKNINSLRMIDLLDTSLNNFFKDTSYMILNIYKYLIAFEYEILSKQNIFKKIYKDLNNFTIIEKKSSYKTLAFIILEIIILINDSIDNNQLSKDFFSNLVQCTSKLYIFERRYLSDDVFEKIIDEVFNFNNLEYNNKN